MAGRDISLNIALQAAQAIADAERLKSGLEGVDEALEGTKTAGQQMADGLSSAAQDFSTEIEKAKRFADELGQALGPELSAQLGQSGLDEYAAALSAAGMSGDELSAFARSIPGELAAGEQAARDLGRALGPELSAQLGQAGLEGIVGDLHTAGLAFEDISQDADALGSSIRQLDGVRTGTLSTGLDTVATSTRKAGGEADRTRGMFANMVGNLVGQLTGFSGVLGPVAQGLSDVADEAVQGGGNLKTMALAGAGLAGVGIAVSVIAGELKKQAAVKAFDAKQVEMYKEVLKGTGDALTDITNKLTEVGKVTVALGTGKDITEELARVGVGLDQYTQLVTAGVAEVDKWAAAQVGVDELLGDSASVMQVLAAGGEDLGTAYAGMREEAELLAKAEQQRQAFNEISIGTQERLNATLEAYIATKDPISQFPAEFARIGAAIESGATPQVKDVLRVVQELGITGRQAFDLATTAADRWKTSLEGVVTAGEAARAAGEGAAEATVAAGAAVRESGLVALEGAVTVARDEAAAAADRASAAAGREAAALRDNVTALDERVSAQRASVDAGYALADSQDAFAQATLDATVAMNEGTPGEAAAAYRDLAQAADQVAQNTVRVYEETQKANGASVSRTQAIDIENGSLLAQAAAVSGPLRSAILDHIGQLNGIPPAKLTKIEALLDAGKIGQAERLIEHTSRTRKATLKADADTKEAENRLERAARKKTVPILAQAVTAGAESQLNRMARRRLSTTVAAAVTAGAESQLNRTARDRALKLVASAVTAAAEGNLNRTARDRALRIAASAVTAAAEGDLNETARDRALTITADAATAGAAAQIAGVANAPYNATINVTAAGIGAVQSAIAGLRAAAVIRPMFE